mmetsp:Transcript_11489/g.34878  ORF Transcript_11489/g.34878 Transcript_11489/m.34878 type:complete len:362 (+) Transcript_11489:707-1792(+)
MRCTGRLLRNPHVGGRRHGRAVHIMGRRRRRAVRRRRAGRAVPAMGSMLRQGAEARLRPLHNLSPVFNVSLTMRRMRRRRVVGVRRSGILRLLHEASLAWNTPSHLHRSARTLHAMHHALGPHALRSAEELLVLRLALGRLALGVHVLPLMRLHRGRLRLHRSRLLHRRVQLHRQLHHHRARLLHRWRLLRALRRHGDAGAASRAEVRVAEGDAAHGRVHRGDARNEGALQRPPAEHAGGRLQGVHVDGQLMVRRGDHVVVRAVQRQERRHAPRVLHGLVALRVPRPPHVLAHRRVPVVLDGVVGAPLEELRDLGPLVSQARLRLVDDELLLLRPGRLLDERVEVIQPPRAALLARAVRPR